MQLKSDSNGDITSNDSREVKSFPSSPSNKSTNSGFADAKRGVLFLDLPLDGKNFVAQINLADFLPESLSCMHTLKRTEYFWYTPKLAEAISLAESGFLVDAEAILRPCLEARKHALGDTHPSTTMVKGHLAYIYIKLGRYKNAESMLVVRAEPLHLFTHHDSSSQRFFPSIRFGFSGLFMAVYCRAREKTHLYPQGSRVPSSCAQAQSEGGSTPNRSPTE